MLLPAAVLAATVGSSSGSAAAATPMRGWMTWERYTCLTDCARFPETCISERLIRTMADAMQRDGFVAAGYNYIQIDDCCAWERPGCMRPACAPSRACLLACCLPAV